MYIYGGVLTVMVLVVVGGSFREWNIGKDNLRDRNESGLKSMVKALVFGLIIAIICGIIFS